MADLRVADLRGRVGQQRRLGPDQLAMAARSACRVVAPITSSSPSALTPASSSSPPMSISTAGVASRSFIIGSSE